MKASNVVGSILIVAAAVGPMSAKAMVPSGQHEPERATQIERVAMGCGLGRTRDAAGRCRHRFNLFDHRDHRRFNAYRHEHCTAVQTPNGVVRRCRI